MLDDSMPRADLVLAGLVGQHVEERACSPVRTAVVNVTVVVAERGPLRSADALRVVEDAPADGAVMRQVGPTGPDHQPNDVGAGDVIDAELDESPRSPADAGSLDL